MITEKEIQNLTESFCEAGYYFDFVTPENCKRLLEAKDAQIKELREALSDLIKTRIRHLEAFCTDGVIDRVEMIHKSNELNSLDIEIGRLWQALEKTKP